MFRKCVICDKGAIPGKNVVRKGLAKKKGGTGQKIVRATKRLFLPNLQKIRIILDGRPQRVYLCTKCLKTGRFQKA